MASNKSDVPLLASNRIIDSPSQSNTSSKSKCSVLKWLTCPLDILICPLSSCIRLNCWKNRRYFQYDCCIQSYGILQVLIGALWSSSVLATIEQITSQQQKTTELIAAYCIITFTLCNVFIIIMQRLSFFNEKISFFVGALGHIVAFGVKDLLFQIMSDYFSSSLELALLYLFISIFIAITIIYGVSISQKNVCFAVNTLYDQRHGIRDAVVNASSSFIKKDINDEIYESDFMDILLADDNINDLQMDNHNHNIQHENEERESFADLIKEVNIDAFTIAVALIFTEVVAYIVTDHFIILEAEESEGSNAEEEEEESELTTTDIALYMGIIILIIFVIFRLFVYLISRLQVKRDRAIYKMFKSLHSRKIDATNDDHDLEVSNENCFISYCIRFSYKTVKFSEHVITFIVGFCGWAAGWAVSSTIYSQDEIAGRLGYAMIVTVFGILCYWLRSYYLRRALQKWKTKMIQTNKRKTTLIQIENDDLDKKKDNEMSNENISEIGHKVEEMDIFNAKSKLHERLYMLSHFNFFYRKYFGLIVALPWELALDLALADLFDNDESLELIVRFGIAIFATIIFSYIGVNFIEIEQEARQHSTSHATSKLLKGNYMKLKYFTK